MKKNPLFLLLGISATFFLLFLAFVFFAFGSLSHDGQEAALLAGGSGNVGVIPIEGVIMESDKIVKQIEKFQDNKDIKGIILRIDSPGGAVGPSQEIYEAVLRAKKEKPIIASFGAIAASGGYYIAVAADQIITNAGTLTGSIGVISQHMNLSEAYKWAKVERYSIKSGKFKDAGADYRSMTQEERELFQGLSDSIYGQFVAAVSTGRKIPLDVVKGLAEGKVYSGAQAVSLGLADKLGGMQLAVDEMKVAAKLKAKPKLVYPKKKKASILESFSSDVTESLLNGVMSRLGVMEGKGGFLPKGVYFL